MFIPEEKHDGTRVVEFVHLVEIGDFIDVDEVEDGKVFAFIGYAVEDFVLFHALFVIIATEADHDDTVVFGHDCLVDVPAGV
jgi:hypothetical protein